MLGTQTYRAAPSAFVVFGCIWGVPCIALTWALLVKHQGLLPILYPLAGYGVTTYWLLRFRLSFDDDKVTYRSLFSGTHSISYSAIRSIERADSRPRESALTISVRDFVGTELRINTKVFSIGAAHKLWSLSPRNQVSRADLVHQKNL